MKTFTDTAHTPADLLKELQSLVVEAEKMMADSLTEHSADAIEGIRARLGTAQERLSELYEGARRRVVTGAKCTDAAIRANPYQSLAVAVGFGLLAGVILGRRTR